MDKQNKLINGVITPLIASWCFVSMISLVRSGIYKFELLNFVSEISPITFIFQIGAVFCTLSAINRIVRNSCIYKAILLIMVSIYAAILIRSYEDTSFFVGISIACAVIGYFAFRDDKLKLPKVVLSDRHVRWILFGLAVFFVLYVGGLTTLRYLNFVSSTYDFGIFSQMFYYMKETLLPMTTCERNGLLSHFSIHISPILYSLLPGYLIFPSPIYLQVMQSLILASGVIPLYLLSRNSRHSAKVTLAICALYLFYPALIGGAFYDIHENMFLTPLILWLFYFLERDQIKGIILFSLLTLMVKEDAALYVLFIGLYVILNNKRLKLGLVISCMALAWFVTTLIILKNFGNGAMTDRFSNFISDPQWGLLSVGKTILCNPAYLFKEVFTPEKIKFILLMLLPIGLIPILSRNLKQLILMVPFVVINLMPNYIYQHSIYFQYTFGVSAIFFYLVVINARELKPVTRRYALSFAGMGALIICLSHISGFTSLALDATQNHSDYQLIQSCLDQVPANASVQASGYYLPHLSQRKNLYDHTYNQKSLQIVETEYVVLDLRPGCEEDMNAFISQYEQAGYLRIAYEPDLIVIFQKPDAVQS